MVKKNAMRPLESPIPKEVLKICPYADPSCKICRLSAKNIDKIHELRLSKGWTIKQVSDYASATGLFGKSYNTITNHFKKHVKLNKQVELIKDEVPEVAEILRHSEEINKSNLVATDKDVEKAFSSLVRMVTSFATRVNSIAEIAGSKIDDKKKMKKELDGMTPLQLMGTISSLQKESISQIRALSSLRTPKVIVAQFFQQFIDDSTRDFNTVLLDAFGELREEITHALGNGGMNEDVYKGVFRKMASEYKNRMIMIRQDHLSRLSKALSDIDKVV